MRGPLALALAAQGTLAPTACTHGHEDESARSAAAIDIHHVAGCYGASIEPWQFELSEKELQRVAHRHRDNPTDLAAITLPDRFELAPLPVPRPTSGSVMRVFPLSSDDSSALRHAGWTPHGADSIRIAWADGYVGFVIHLPVLADSLDGIARSFSDEGSLDGHAHVAAWRINCATLDRSSRRSHDWNAR